MSTVRSHEEACLAPAMRVLDDHADSEDGRAEVLEQSAAMLGGFSVEAFHRQFGTKRTLSAVAAYRAAGKVLEAINACPIHPALVLSALARPRLNAADQRESGCYYTDYRLAGYIAGIVAKHCKAGAQIIDPAAGTGTLLVATTVAARAAHRTSTTKWLADSITAWDLSEYALRGARLALASLTNDVSAIARMVARWRCHDSLLGDPTHECAFDVVVGNPPWNKVKVTRHEFLQAAGRTRHYGADYGRIDSEQYAARLSHVAAYRDLLFERYPRMGKGEPDLYRAFVELFFKLERRGGRIAVLVPAGLIRAEGTESLRRALFDGGSDLSITVMENRARFFAIDTRFKFLALTALKAPRRARGDRLRVVHAQGADDGVTEVGRASFGKQELRAIRQDLSIPEVRSEAEWRLFRLMSRNGFRRVVPDGPWSCTIVREVDMTRDRAHFARIGGNGRLPLVEGRMVHQHRFGAKAYSGGTGRRARWDVVPLGTQRCAPQFWYPASQLPENVRARTCQVRAGFCDITGQTNERSMLAALIPSGVVCGNKVPTVTFPTDPSEDRLLLWLAVVNSVPFDWALRRLVTTTVNYFVLRSVPFPAVDVGKDHGRRLVVMARALQALSTSAAAVEQWQIAKLRAAIDVQVLLAYGLRFADLKLMLADFPLLDRAQPALDGEERSTITRDFLLAEAAKHCAERACEYAQRLRAAHRTGAVPYIPSQVSLSDQEHPTGECNG